MDTLRTHKAFSTVELLIAMAIGLMAISAVLISTFGSQSLISGGQTNADAVSIAQQLIENEQALARQDFNLVNPSTSTTTNGIYQSRVYVSLEPDLVTKLVTTLVSWTGANGQSLYTRLSSLVTNLDNVNSPNMCNSVLSGDWQNPQMIPSGGWDLSQLGVNTNSGNGFALSGIVAENNRLYVTASQIPGSYHDGFTFFIFDITNPLQPAYLGGGDSIDLNAVTIGGNYAYAAAANSAQMRVIDISNPASPKFKVAINASGVTPGQAVGDSIFYYNGYVYLGLTAAGSNKGPEFHIFNVQNPLSPVEVGSWPAAGVDFNNAINGIFVKGHYAYLAHPQDSINNEQLTVLDISTPSNPQRKSGFFANGGSGGNGKSLALVGDTLYFGRTATKLSGLNDTIPEFYMLNNADPTAIPSTPLGSVPLPASGDSINNLSVRDYLAFFVTNTQFQIWNISNPSNIIPWSPDGTTATFLPLPSGKGTAVDCTSNYFYVISQSSQGQNKDLISVVAPGVTKITPTIVSEIDNSAGTAVSSVSAGAVIHDKATVSGSSGTPTGSVNFTYYTDGICSANPAAAGSGIAMVAGVANPSSPETPATVGSYSFKVHYTGDTTYSSADGPCESINVTQATPAISTTASGGGTVGIQINDRATVSGGASPTGTVTFNLYAPSDPSCSASPVFTDSNKALSAGSAGPTANFITNAVGTYHWKATYNGDTNNNSVTSNCGDEPVAISAAPFDYSLSAPAITINKGSSATENVTVTKVSGAVSSSVLVSLTGLPNKVTYSGSASCTPNPTCVIPFLITVASNGKSGTVTVNGTAPAHTTTFSLTAQ